MRQPEYRVELTEKTLQPITAANVEHNRLAQAVKWKFTINTESGDAGSHHEDYIMATIVIKDLSESLDLDRKAMLAIIGGARIRVRQPFDGRTILRNTRIVNFPTGFSGASPQETGGQTAGRATLK